MSTEGAAHPTQPEAGLATERGPRWREGPDWTPAWRSGLSWRTGLLMGGPDSLDAPDWAALRTGWIGGWGRMGLQALSVWLLVPAEAQPAEVVERAPIDPNWARAGQARHAKHTLPPLPERPPRSGLPAQRPARESRPGSTGKPQRARLQSPGQQLITDGRRREAEPQAGPTEGPRKATDPRGQRGPAAPRDRVQPPRSGARSDPSPAGDRDARASRSAQGQPPRRNPQTGAEDPRRSPSQRASTPRDRKPGEGERRTAGATAPRFRARTGASSPVQHRRLLHRAGAGAGPRTDRGGTSSGSETTGSTARRGTRSALPGRYWRVNPRPLVQGAPTPPPRRKAAPPPGPTTRHRSPDPPPSHPHRRRRQPLSPRLYRAPQPIKGATGSRGAAAGATGAPPARRGQRPAERGRQSAGRGPARAGTRPAAPPTGGAAPPPPATGPAAPSLARHRAARNQPRKGWEAIAAYQGGSPRRQPRRSPDSRTPDSRSPVSRSGGGWSEGRSSASPAGTSARQGAIRADWAPEDPIFGQIRGDRPRRAEGAELPWNPAAERALREWGPAGAPPRDPDLGRSSPAMGLRRPPSFREAAAWAAAEEAPLPGRRRQDGPRRGPAAGEDASSEAFDSLPGVAAASRSRPRLPRGMGLRPLGPLPPGLAPASPFHAAFSPATTPDGSGGAPAPSGWGRDRSGGGKPRIVGGWSPVRALYLESGPGMSPPADATATHRRMELPPLPTRPRGEPQAPVKRAPFHRSASGAAPAPEAPTRSGRPTDPTGPGTGGTLREALRGPQLHGISRPWRPEAGPLPPQQRRWTDPGAAAAPERSPLERSPRARRGSPTPARDSVPPPFDLSGDSPLGRSERSRPGSAAAGPDWTGRRPAHLESDPALPMAALRRPGSPGEAPVPSGPRAGFRRFTTPAAPLTWLEDPGVRELRQPEAQRRPFFPPKADKAGGDGATALERARNSSHEKRQDDRQARILEDVARRIPAGRAPAPAPASPVSWGHRRSGSPQNPTPATGPVGLWLDQVVRALRGPSTGPSARASIDPMRRGRRRSSAAIAKVMRKVHAAEGSSSPTSVRAVQRTLVQEHRKELVHRKIELRQVQAARQRLASREAEARKRRESTERRESGRTPAIRHGEKPRATQAPKAAAEPGSPSRDPVKLPVRPGKFDWTDQGWVDPAKNTSSSSPAAPAAASPRAVPAPDSGAAGARTDGGAALRRSLARIAERTLSLAASRASPRPATPKGPALAAHSRLLSTRDARVLRRKRLREEQGRAVSENLDQRELHRTIQAAGLPVDGAGMRRGGPPPRPRGAGTPARGASPSLGGGGPSLRRSMERLQLRRDLQRAAATAARRPPTVRSRFLTSAEGRRQERQRRQALRGSERARTVTPPLSGGPTTRRQASPPGASNLSWQAPESTPGSAGGAQAPRSWQAPGLGPGQGADGFFTPPEGETSTAERYAAQGSDSTRSAAVRHATQVGRRHEDRSATVSQLAEGELLEILRQLTLREPEAMDLMAELRRHVEDLRYLKRIREL